MANDSSSNIIKNTSLITLATLTSRVTGLVRTWAMAFALGNTVLASAYNIAYNMPAMIYELAATGILATAFLPLYLLQKEKNGDSGAADVRLQHPYAHHDRARASGACLLDLLCASHRDANVRRGRPSSEGDGHLLLPRVRRADLALWIGRGHHRHPECGAIVFGTFARARAQQFGGHRDHVRLCAALFVEPLLRYVVVGGGNIARCARAVRCPDSCAHKTRRALAARM